MDEEIKPPNPSDDPEAFEALVGLNKHVPVSVPNTIAEIFEARILEYGNYEEKHVTRCLRYMLQTWTLPKQHVMGRYGY